MCVCGGLHPRSPPPLAGKSRLHGRILFGPLPNTNLAQPTTIWAIPNTIPARPKLFWPDPTFFLQPNTIWARPKSMLAKPNMILADPMLYYVRPNTIWARPNTSLAQPTTIWARPDTILDQPNIYTHIYSIRFGPDPVLFKPNPSWAERKRTLRPKRSVPTPRPSIAALWGTMQDLRNPHGFRLRGQPPIITDSGQN